MLTSPTFRRSLLASGSLATLLLLAGCDDLTQIDSVTDPNNASIESVLTNASLPQLNALAVGTEASLRLGHLGNSTNNQVLGTLGREVTVLAQTESRWYFELQGRASPTASINQLDDAAFYNGQYTGFARVGRAARVFRASAANSSVIDATQKSGVDGFTRTYEALSKLHLLMLQGDNGIRVDLDNIERPGPFVARDAALTNIRQQLDEANTNLGAAGSTFFFPLSSGYAGFNAPATFAQVNRGLAARVALYQKDYAGALTAIGASFYSRTAALGLGPKMVFSATTASDAGNAYFQVADGSPSALVSVPTNFVTEAETGDLRLAKAPIRTTPLTVGGITGVYEARVFPTQNSPLDIIRNEELLLIAAEARANTGDLAGALADINVIRTRAGGLPALTAAQLPNLEAYINEILRQRRYSLFYEGHRLVDLRRLDRLRTQVAPNQTLPFSTTPFKLFPNLERPAAEKAFDAANPTP
ncbi:RagB/SusD family nutrient uptake outer membrane protein [Hymenobacter lapidiphilus]|uniref:RagB/SusD family nutrient uptake outer membrane protein n=1 Tax=Hymenobacter lapidiphilus TaxID=2608003 RepID=A0A7Y7U4Y4_9BACT|nr:RagB/SusD family nutrient uptake outer membrane protein [Hymenobacter lapidiphilus]NVO29910.1 RagB/SusD family nutrient uptake outer membrane protein [Hymenobacter lapidiphilus]